MATGLACSRRLRFQETSAASINGYWYITLAGTTVIGSNTYLLVNLDGSTFVSADGSGNAVMDAALDAADDFTIVDATIDDSPSVMASNQGGGGNMTIIGGYWKSVGAAGAVISAGRNLENQELEPVLRR